MAAAPTWSKRSACAICAIGIPSSTLVRGRLAGRGNQFTTRRRYNVGQLIVGAGERENWLAIVLSGVITLTKAMADGRQQIVGLLFASDFLGRPFGTGSPYVAEAATPVELCCFERQYFENVMLNCPDVRQIFLERTLDELDFVREWLLLVGRKTAEERVASLVLLMAKRMCGHASDALSQPRTLRFSLPLSRTQIAECLGLRIETVCRQITRLQMAGIIESNNGRAITIHDIVKLERMVE
jgi:CRP/FNR family transcriptional regulator, anaerobic regulatory protein